MTITTWLKVDSFDDLEPRDDEIDPMTKAVQREYRKATGSRRQTFVWRWNANGWLSDGSGVNYHGTLCGYPRDRHQSGYPVLAECWVYVRTR
jgi:hypothetical protein